MGRLTQATRASFEDHLHRMRTEYREALMSMGRREAFDRLVEAWSSELGAISYAESSSIMDLILLTGEVDNRTFLETMRLRLNDLDRMLNEAEQSAREQPRPMDQVPTNVSSLHARPFRDEESNNQLKRREPQ